MAQDVQRPKKIDLDVPGPIARLCVENSCGGVQHPGVVNNDANSAQLGRGFVDGLPHCWLVRDIARNSKPADFIGQPLDCRDAPRKKSHPMTLLGEKSCCRLAYASTCTSDQ